MTFLGDLFINYVVYIVDYLNMNINTPQGPINTINSSNSTENTFNVSDERELIKEELNSLIKNIDSIINERFLTKEYYPNPDSWQNIEIANICNHSASDIEERVKNGRWIFYMNPCLSQTLYSVNKLKKRFPNISKDTNLCIEMLRLPELNIHNIHAYISIQIPGNKPIIIDYARNNDVYVYQWDYSNKSSQKTETETTFSIPAYAFNEKDNIFDIAKRFGIIKEGDIRFNGMIDGLVKQLSKDNSESNYQNWSKNHQWIVIYNSLKTKK